MKHLLFNQGPLLQVTFQTSFNLILSTRLELSDHFSALILGTYSSALYKQITDWLQRYKEHISAPTLPLDFSKQTPFRCQVLKSLSQVDFGTCISYAELAQKACNSKAIRAVGTTCKKNPYPLIIPCHRVIRSDGSIGEFNGGVEIKKRLLDFEKAAL